MSYNKNEVKKLGTDNTPIYSGFSGSNYSNILTVGKAVNTYYMYDAIGVWKNQAEIDAYSAAHNGQPVTFEGKQIQPGDIRYRDVNNDGKYDKDNDRDYLGSPTPKFVFGMTNRFSYKNFDLSILLTATIISTPAALAWLMASTVCGMMPSSAATTRMAMSVTIAPRARMDVNAS